MKSIGLKLFIIVAVFITLFSAFLFYRTYLISSGHVYHVVNQQADRAADLVAWVGISSVVHGEYL